MGHDRHELVPDQGMRQDMLHAGSKGRRGGEILSIECLVHWMSVGSCMGLRWWCPKVPNDCARMVRHH